MDGDRMAESASNPESLAVSKCSESDSPSPACDTSSTSDLPTSSQDAKPPDSSLKVTEKEEGKSMSEQIDTGSTPSTSDERSVEIHVLASGRISPELSEESKKDIAGMSEEKLPGSSFTAKTDIETESTSKLVDVCDKNSTANTKTDKDAEVKPLISSANINEESSNQISRIADTELNLVISSVSSVSEENSPETSQFTASKANTETVEESELKDPTSSLITSPNVNDESSNQKSDIVDKELNLERSPDSSGTVKNALETFSKSTASEAKEAEVNDTVSTVIASTNVEHDSISQKPQSDRELNLKISSDNSATVECSSETCSKFTPDEHNKSVQIDNANDGAEKATDSSLKIVNVDCKALKTSISEKLKETLQCSTQDDREITTRSENSSTPLLPLPSEPTEELDTNTSGSADRPESMDWEPQKNEDISNNKEDASMNTDRKDKSNVSSSQVGEEYGECSNSDQAETLNSVISTVINNDDEEDDSIKVAGDESSTDPLNPDEPSLIKDLEEKNEDAVASEPLSPIELAESSRTTDDILIDDELSTTVAAGSDSLEKNKDTTPSTTKELPSETAEISVTNDRESMASGKEEVSEVLQSKDDERSISTDGDTETDKPTSTLDADEVCIVPDTEPRVPTEKEKANAVEKKKGKQADLESKLSSTEKRDETGKVNVASEQDDVVQNPAVTKRKTGIQLVSTSSLVSRKDTSDKDDGKDDIETVDIDDCSAEKDIQNEDAGEQKCSVCEKVTICKYKTKSEFICGDQCYMKKRRKSNTPFIRARNLGLPYVHKCGQCCKKVDPKHEKSLTWETMDFCTEMCLERYQKSVGSHCANCKGAVQSSSLGKYCVRFGYDMKQFCSAPCLEDFKKGLKVCSYCQKDISAGTEGFLAPVGDKGQFKDFCTQECMEKYDLMSQNSPRLVVSHTCAVCNEMKVVEVEILFDSKVHKFCSEPCFAAFKFVNNLDADLCDMCKKYYDQDRQEKFSVFYDDAPHSFCCKTCMNVYILAKRKIVPCSWCKVKKYNFDMIRKAMPHGPGFLMLCSLNCLRHHSTAKSAAPPGLTPPAPPKKNTCEYCNSAAATQYHLTMSDASVRNFCSSNCVVNFQAKFPSSPMSAGVDKTPYPLGAPRKIVVKKITNDSGSMPVISSVTSLAPLAPKTPDGVSQQIAPPLPVSTPSMATKAVETVTIYKQQFIVRPPVHPEMSNCGVQVKPKTHTKSVSCRPHGYSVGTQTDDSLMNPVLIPVPVPIYIPTPMHMFTSPYPVPVPIVLPIPVPIFIPTTRNSAKGIMKEIKRIQEKIPSDPFEAELLMMAEMVANEKKAENTDSESEDGGDPATDGDANDNGNATDADFNAENVDGSNTFGDDVLQMALKMASELDEPAVDYEATVPPANAQSGSSQNQTAAVPKDDSEEDENEGRISRSVKKRGLRVCNRPPSVNSKRSRKSSASDPSNSLPTTDSKAFPTTMGEMVEKADTNMCLKFSLGVNAWKNWVSQKNIELEKNGCSGKKVKLLKTSLLQLTADELNYSLCLFVKEVRKPNGDEFTPDTIYYMCLGIQQYMVENGRIENIFSDPYYEKFTDCLYEVTKQFSALPCDESQYLVARIEEEHLWESKQLGAHSPYVLLSTLMFFNTKHFSLMTVEEHLQLSFSHIMKHWKRSPGAPGGPKAGVSRNVLLRFYPPQSALASNSKKKKMYEQQENENNALRCPVKLYEFYLSKCPESVRTRNDVFYLLPERSCVPDSPVWYSTMALGHEQLQKMLNRIKMVKEVLVL